MTKYFLLFLYFTTLLSFGQQTPAPEDKIYDAVDSFTANPSVQNLQKLESYSNSLSTNTKNKNVLLALVVLNCNKGYYENSFGKTAKAILSYEKAWKIYQKNKLSNYDITEYALKPLGNLYTLIGDYNNAENIIKQYYFVASQEKNEAQKQAAVLNLSNVYQNTGRIDQAISLLEQTVRTDRLTKIQKGLLYNNLGSNYFLNTQANIMQPLAFENAENAFLKAASLLEKEPSQYEALTNSYSNLSQLKLARNDPDQALFFYTKAKQTFEKINNPNPRKEAQLYCDAANIFFKQGKTAAANAALKTVFKILIPSYSDANQSLPKKTSLYAETILLDALDLQSELFLAQSQPKKALESYALAFHIEDLFQSLLVYENSKIIIQMRNRIRTEKCIAIYQTLFEKENKTSYLESAFVLAEKTKSIVLKNSLTSKESQSAEEQSILEQLQNCNTTIIKEQQKGATATVAKINDAVKKQNELMLVLKEIQSKRDKQSTADIDIKKLYSKLENDKAVMVEYFSGYHNTYSFTLQEHQITLRSFSNDAHTAVKIVQFIDYFNDANAISNDVLGYNHYSNLAYQLLQLPAGSTYKNLFIIPDGVLNFLPFEALITKETATTNFAKMHYLVNDYVIGYNSSATFYLEDHKLQKHDKNILGVFPVFANSNYELSFSKKELTAIKKNFEGTYFENAAATFNNFQKNAANYAILHLSTHASSGDLETAASIKFSDQEVLYSQLYNMNINPDLVVLSACETGIGKLFKSEGAMSVARGFQFAGAKNLLFSLWRVNDYTTAAFMAQFYNNLKSGQSFMEANHQAKLDFLGDTTIPNAKKSPYYWSAFVYYGSLETDAESTNYWYYGIGFLILISLFLIYIRKRK